MEITQCKIMIGNKVLNDYGTLNLEYITGNNFSYELPLKGSNPILFEYSQLSGKNIYIWITADDGQKNFLIGTVHQIKQSQYSHEPGEALLSGNVKKQIYALSLLTNYRLTLPLAILIPAMFLTTLTYLFLDQKQHLLKQTGTVTAFSKRSGGARSPALYKFKAQEFKASFERRYEGFSRLTAENLRDEIYDRSALSFPYSSKQHLKPADQRRYSWYIESNDLTKLDLNGVTQPYIYLHQVENHSNAMFLYDLYTYVFEKYNMLTYAFLSFMSTIAFLLMGVGMKRGNNFIWKIYAGAILIIFITLFII